MSSAPTKKKYKKKQANKQSQRQQDNTSSIQSSVISSTINLTSTSILRRQSSKVEIEDFSTFILPQQTVKEFKFQYNFNQYLRLFLIKALPPKNPQIKINPKEKTLRGPQVDSQKLIKRIKQQFQIYVMKVIRFDANADIEEVEFHLQKKYQIKIYKKKFLRLTVEDLVKHYNFVEEPKMFLKRIQEQQLILIRVQKKLQQECIQDINSLINQSAQVQQSKIQRPRMDMSQRLSKPSSTSSQQEIVEDQDEPTYYGSQIASKVKPVRSQYAGNKFPKKIEEPTEDDSISVVGGKRNDKRKVQQNNYEQYKPIKRESILTREYQSESFNRKNFENWIKNHKLLKGNVEIIQDKDPYDDKGTAHTYIVKLFQSESKSITRKQLIEALDVYLKFRKVIMLKLKNQKYKEKLVQKYDKEEQGLTIRFIKGYKSPKWPESQMWKHVIKHDYTQTKKAANSQYFQLFFIQGLKQLVQQSYQQIKRQIQKEPLDDSNEQILVKLDQLCDIYRGNQNLKNMIKKYIQKMMETFKHCCTLTSIQYPLSYIQLLVNVKFEHQDQFEKTVKDQIISKVQNQIKVQQYKTDHPINKNAYQKIQKKNIIIVKKIDKGFTYASNVYDLPSVMNQINAIFNSLNTIQQKQLFIQDKIVVKQLEQKIEEIKNEKEFSQIKCNYLTEKSTFKIYGKQFLVDTVLKRLEDLKQEILAKRINYIQIAKKKQADLLNEGTFLKDLYSKYQIVINASNKKEIACKIVLRKNVENYKKKNILMIKSKSLDYAPYGSVIAFKNIHEIDLFKNYFIKTFRNYINKHKDESFNENTRKYTFLIKNKEISQLLKDALAINPNISNHIVLIMPEKGKQAFVKSIVKVLLEEKQYYEKQTTIMIIEYGLATDIQQHINIAPYVKGKKLQLKDQTITKYYVQDNAVKFYYSESGNRKILTAQKQGFNQIILYNEDLNITHNSHELHPQTLQIIHLQSHKAFPIVINNTKVQFTLKNQVYQIPPPLSTNILSCITKGNNPITISLGVYEIDLSTMKQINLFSGYQRKLCKQETIIKADINQDEVQAFYNYKVAEIEYCYYFDESLMANFSNSRVEVVEFMEKAIKQKQISYAQYKNVETPQLETIRSTIQQDQQTQFFYNHTKKTITLKTLDDTSLNRYQQMIKMFLSNFNERDPNKIKYPDFWEPQKDDIEIFQVNENTPQFKNIQTKFTVGKIKKLKRVQNKIIYKKYFEESLFLQAINGGKIKTMQLFHGTRTTNPQQIYRDKQESFNINYSSDNNLLGKGIYFAEKPEYSNDYRHTQILNQGKIFGIGASQQYSMFLCEVLVGQSQKCKQHNGSIKDTSYKDLTKKIKFESMTDFLNNSNIYVVYKSRRAYPLYLIQY